MLDKTNELTSKLPPRIQKIRSRLKDIKPSLSLHRTRAFTKVAKENLSLHPILLKAKCFHYVCETLPIFIEPEELIVGHPAGMPRGGVFSPDICWRWLHNELETVSTRKTSPYKLSDEDKKYLEEEVFPFWKGRSIDEIVSSELKEMGIYEITDGTSIIDCEVKSTSGGGDLCPGYDTILLKKGYEGVKQEALKHLENASLETDEDFEKTYFWKATVQVCEVMILLAERYADLADQMVERESNPKRKEELRTIAQNCRMVPKNPPTNFHQALQSVWFGQMSVYLEENNAGTSPGRTDQYLYPFLQQDIDQGKLTEEEAIELLYCFLLKLNENVWPLGENASYYFAGYMPFQNMVVGGSDINGEDVSNPLTYMILECATNVHMYQPSLCVRIHNNTPPEIYQAINDLIKSGIGMPAIFCDDPYIKMIQTRGVSREDAQDYCAMGCTEPHLSGKFVRWASAMYTNFPIAIEFAMNRGTHLKSGKKLGLDTGTLDQFTTFEEFENAVKEQLNNLVKISAKVTLACQRAHRTYAPKPVGSALINGCMEKGKDLMAGGAVYNAGPGVIVVGTADYANSMFAIKKLVYEDKYISLEELVEVLKNNFEGRPEVLNKCRKLAKFGNDIEEVDYFAKDIVHHISKEINSYNSLHCPLELGTLSVSTHVPQGETLGALPSGRLAGASLADGLGPSQGTDLKGPTAIIKSVSKIDPVDSSDGTLLNIKIDPKMLETEKGNQCLTALIKGHMALGGAHIQFNCVSLETLKDAQVNPDKHRNLIVRVAGYSAYFTELCKEIQDEVISRTTHMAW